MSCEPIAFILIWSYIKAVRTLPGYTTDDIEQLDETGEDIETGITIRVSQIAEGEVGMQPLLQRGSQPSSVMVKRDEPVKNVYSKWTTTVLG
ncbi:unnamed protein product [Umbelopsis sp. WA50703]